MPFPHKHDSSEPDSADGFGRLDRPPCLTSRVAGLGRPIVADPDVPKRLLSGEVDRAASPEAALHPFHLLPWNNMQLERLADGLDPDLSLDGVDAVAQFIELETRNMTALLQHRA